MWGEPDPEDDIPEWMLAKTYQNGGKPKRIGKTLEQIAEEALKKPPIKIDIKEPGDLK